jgi:hypothetical protein
MLQGTQEALRLGLQGPRAMRRISGISSARSIASILRARTDPVVSMGFQRTIHLLVPRVLSVRKSMRMACAIRGASASIAAWAARIKRALSAR